MRMPAAGTMIALAVAGLAATGCGFKGPLKVPERSEAVIIRAPAQAAPGAAATAPAGTAAPTPATTTIKPREERPPPPPLPGSTQGG